MRNRAHRAVLVVLVALAAVCAACGSAKSGPAIDALVGKRVDGTTSGWHAIKKNKAIVAHGAATDPVETYLSVSASKVDSITFFEFTDDKAAEAFYQAPTKSALLLEARPQALRGNGPVGAPSRWLDLGSCTYESGPNPSHAPKGIPSDTMTASGSCAIGSPSSNGVASITRRGDVVVIVNLIGTPIPGAAVPSAISAAPANDDVAKSSGLAKSALALMTQNGIS